MRFYVCSSVLPPLYWQFYVRLYAPFLEHHHSILNCWGKALKSLRGSCAPPLFNQDSRTEHLTGLQSTSLFSPQCICAFIWAHLCSLPCICAFMCACLGALHICALHLRFSDFLTIFWQSRKLHVATRALLLTLSSDRFDVSIVRFAVSRDRFSV